MNRIRLGGTPALRSLALSTALVIGAGAATTWAQPQQLSQEEKATMVLNSARIAYNEHNYALAADRFRAFLKDFPRRHDSASARYGLALTLLEGPEKDFNAIVETLTPAVTLFDTAERPYALYYLASAHRALGNQELEKAPASASDSPKAKPPANPHLEKAILHFGQAAASFAALVKTPPPTDAKQLPAEMEWANRARCDQAELLVRLGRSKEALALIEPWSKDPSFAKSAYRPQGLYLLGYAAFRLQDYIAAGKNLAALAPFTDPAIGVHARYLLARTHHLADERPEAAANYEAVIASFTAERMKAEGTLKDPNALKDQPEERARLEALVRSPAPDYVVRTTFYWGVLLYEQGKFADAAVKFTNFVQQYPKSPLLAEAQLRQGMTQVQLKQFPAGIQALQKQIDHAQLGDQACFWLARAQIGAADPNNPKAYVEALKPAIDNLRKAADKARQLAKTDPQAKARQGDILMELADTQQLAKQFKEAAATYQQVLDAGAYPDWNEAALQRQAIALQLGGQYKESDTVCQRFLQTYPKSHLAAEILFRSADNSFLAAANHADASNPANPEIKRLYGDAIKRFQQVIDKSGEATYVNLAKQGMGTALYQLGQFAEAAKVLTTVPESDRGGELATVSYLIADCLLRTLPNDADDALATARLIDQLTEITYRLDAFIAAAEKASLAPDATMKLGYCHQRIAALMGDPTERQKAVAKARLAYALFMERYPTHALAPVVVFEDAKTMAQLGSIAAAVNLLNRFQNEPLKSTSIAPLALIKLGDYMRLQRRAPEAVNLLTQVRSQYEQTLLKDPARAGWVPMLQYNLGLALKDAGKPAEAQAVFEAIGKQFPDRPEAAESVWRVGQARKEEATTKLDAARKALANAARKSDQAKTAQTAIDEALNSLRQTTDYLQTQSAKLGEKTSTDVRMRMLYDAAWCGRNIADAEIEIAREQLMAEAVQRIIDKAARENPGASPVIRPPDIRMTAIPLQPGEKKVRQLYQAMIDLASDAPLANDARFELADFLMRREEYPAAVKLLSAAMEADPSVDLLDRIRLRLGACHLAAGNSKAAAIQFAAIMQTPRSPLAPHARYGMGECSILNKDWAGAIQQLSAFRDVDTMRSIPGTSDRALLRLSEAYVQTTKWDASRQTLEALVSRFPYSPWINDARYGIGFAWQMQKNYDQAVTAYAEVVSHTGAEVAAKAQLQIGLCRLEQKRYQDAFNALLTVAFTYDYPELTASALCEAARAAIELKQNADATKLLQRVVKENPTGKWAELAQKRLSEIK